MNTRVLRSSLFVCFIVGFSEAKILSEVVHGIEDAASTVVESIANVTLRNDQGEPVLLDLNLGYPETEEETERDLPNSVLFNLYTRDSKNESQQLYLNDTTALKNSNYDINNETVLLIHGWISSGNGSFAHALLTAYLKHGNYNAIVLEWSKIANKPYMWVSKRVRMIGEYAAEFLNFLEEHGTNVTRMTIVGHSLGAHIGGLASRFARTKVGYIAGLDPALPGFETADANSSLTRVDGDYVMIMHTSQIGYKNPNGHSDFYPNNGKLQPGCLVDVSCSHARSYIYFAESINTKKGFWAKECSNNIFFELGLCNSNSDALMGGAEPDFNVKGTYYLKTASKEPYALGRQ